MTPNKLAAELGISPKTLRAWLRREHPRPDALKGTHWHLGAYIVQAAHARWN